MMIQVLDLDFQNTSRAIAAFLITGETGPILIETGPHSCFESLKQLIEKAGFGMGQIKHVFLTHIHLDHAGAAWALADQGATIYVHPVGAPHLSDPSKLLTSAKRIYGKQMEQLWGDLQPIDPSRIKLVEDSARIVVEGITMEALHTPGHATHHIAWKFENQIFCGDIAGIKIDDGPVVPPCPPPDINLEDWARSIARIQAQNPSKIYLTHFGSLDYNESHLEQLNACLEDWANWIKHFWQKGKSIEEATPLFEAYVDNQLSEFGLDENVVEKYRLANPAWMSVAGLYRYWSKKTAE